MLKFARCGMVRPSGRALVVQVGQAWDHDPRHRSCDVFGESVLASRGIFAPLGRDSSLYSASPGGDENRITQLYEAACAGSSLSARVDSCWVPDDPGTREGKAVLLGSSSAWLVMGRSTPMQRGLRELSRIVNRRNRAARLRQNEPPSSTSSELRSPRDNVP
jgi:hypothetical protein